MKNIFLVFGLVLVLVLAGCTASEGVDKTAVKKNKSQDILQQSADLNKKTNCTDSDGGQTPKTKGTAKGVDSKGEIKEYEDKCESEYYLVEYFCSNGYVDSKYVYCSDIPSQEALRCKDGACKPVVCTDSDGGQMPKTKGTAKGMDYNGTIREYEDRCDTQYFLTEYYCNNGYVGSVSGGIDCRDVDGAARCVNGACVK